MGVVDQAAPPRLKELVEFLREVRAEGDVTFHQMAKHGKTTASRASTFIAAASGARLPSHATVRAYVAAAHAAGGSKGSGRELRDLIKRADRLWLAANRERGTGGVVPPVPPYPRPERVRTPEQLTEALTALRERASFPPLRYIELRTAELGCRIARTTAAAILAGTTEPSRAQLQALLECFGLRERSVAAWLARWDRLAARVVPKVEQPHGPVLCADTDPAVQRRREQHEQHEAMLRKIGKLRPYEEYDDWLERQEQESRPFAWWDRLTDEEQAEMEREAEHAWRERHPEEAE